MTARASLLQALAEAFPGRRHKRLSSHLHRGAPPLFIVHGDQDTLTLAADARGFAKAATSTSANPVVYAEFIGVQHCFDWFHSLRFRAVIDSIQDFAAVVAGDEPTP